jgi:hypothetical protein
MIVLGPSGALGELLSRFEQARLGHLAQSWIGNGPNQPVSPKHLRTVFGEDQVQTMSRRSGMAPHYFLSQLSQHIPRLVDSAKAILRTRPIYYSSDAAIRGHVFCSFLALMLQKELADLCHNHGLVIEWADLLRDLDRLQEATIAKDGKVITARTAVAGQVGRVFQAAGIALPPNLNQRAA